MEELATLLLNTGLKAIAQPVYCNIPAVAETIWQMALHACMEASSVKQANKMNPADRSNWGWSHHIFCPMQLILSINLPDNDRLCSDGWNPQGLPMSASKFWPMSPPDAVPNVAAAAAASPMALEFSPSLGWAGRQAEGKWADHSTPRFTFAHGGLLGTITGILHKVNNKKIF